MNLTEERVMFTSMTDVDKRETYLKSINDEIIAIQTKIEQSRINVKVNLAAEKKSLLQEIQQLKLKAKVKAIPLAEKPTAKLEVTTTPHCYGVSNLNFVTTTETVADYFSKFGDLVKVEVLNNKSLGRVNITFSKMFDVKSLKVSKHIIDQRVLKISEPLGGDYDDQTRSVRISGLFANLAESHIIAYFQKFGKIIKWTNSISKHDGFKCTFVKFENYDSAEKVAGIRKHIIYNIEIRAVKAKDY